MLLVVVVFEPELEFGSWYWTLFRALNPGLFDSLTMVSVLRPKVSLIVTSVLVVTGLKDVVDVTVVAVGTVVTITVFRFFGFSNHSCDSVI